MNFFVNYWNQMLATFGITNNWAIIISVIIGTAVADFIQRRVIKVVLDKTGLALRSPFYTIIFNLKYLIALFIWTSGVYFAIAIILTSYTDFVSFIPQVYSVKSTIMILSIVWYLSKVVGGIERYLKSKAEKENGFDEITIEALAKIIKLTFFVIAGIIILSAFGISVSGLLAFGGMGGIMIGYAAKDLLGNIFGGLMIYMDKPFSVGDWIRSPDREIEGTVEFIGWRVTVVRTFDMRPLYIPNGIFSNISIENPSRMTHRRIKEKIKIRIEDHSVMSKITKEVKKMLREHDEIANSQTMIVNFLELNESSIDFFVYTFTKTTNWIKYHEIKEDVLLKIIEIIEANGAKLAYPARTLYMTEEEVNESRF